MKKYQVVLKPLPDEKTKAIVIKKLASLTKKPESTVAALVAKAPVVIFKSVDEKKARVLKKHFGGTIGFKEISKPAPAKPKPAPQPTSTQLGFDDGESVAPSPEEKPESEEIAAPEETAEQSSGLSLEGETPAEAPSPTPSSAAKEKTPSPHVEEYKAKPKKKVSKPFRESYKDHSDVNGHAYEFFCENCNKSYRPDYYSIPSGVGYKISTALKWITQKVSGKMPHDLATMRAKELQQFEKDSFNKSLKLAEQHFLKCQGCGQRVCSSCWNPGKMKCVNCAPLEHDDLPDYMKARMEKEKRDKQSKVQSRFCPGCGAEKVEGAKFCEGCGEELS